MRRASPGELPSQPGESLNFGANVFWREVGVFKMAPSRMRRMILFPFLQQFAGLLSTLMQLHGLLYLYMLYRKRNIDLLVGHFARKRNLFVRKSKELKLRRLRRKKRSRWVNEGRTDQWWQNMITGISPEEDWKKNFRMTRQEFNKLCDELRPYISPNPKSPNRRALSVEKKVALTLYYLKDTGSMWMTANTFGIHQSTVSKVVFEVCDAITKHLGPEYIHLPRTAEEMHGKVSEFELKFGMTQAFGCIDGTHIPIKTPTIDSHDYFCYKQYYSLNVRAVCDYGGTFIDVDCRWPGSVHDAKVFANSSLNHNLRNGRLPQTFNTLIPNHSKVPNYVIGDPAYPLTPYCMKEFEICTTNAQVLFNGLLRSARNQIECAFGRLKARWSILTRKMDFSIELVPTVVYACFVLHNFCESGGGSLDEEAVKAQIRRNQIEEYMNKNVPDPVYSCTTGEGVVVRDTLTSYICQNMSIE